MRIQSHIPLALLTLGWAAPAALADGTEQLGPPSIPIFGAAEVAAAGTGVLLTGAGQIELELPLDATVRQVLLYWEGHDWQPWDHGDTAPITVDGAAVEGMRIGGPSDLFGAAWSSTFRADVTHLDLLGPGANTVSVSGLDFTRSNNGAGLVALYDRPGQAKAVQLYDGNDLANELLPAPFDANEAVTFAFPATDHDRTVTVSMFFAPFFADRASVIAFLADGVQVDLLIDAIGHTDGAAWCTVRHDVFVPAGATTLTVQPLVLEIQTNPSVFLGTNKWAWLMCTASFELESDPGPKAGLTPGFWKNHYGCWNGSGTGLTANIFADDGFNASFGVTPAQSGLANTVSLIQATDLKGGGKNALARHAAAALANSDAGIGYPYTTQEVIDLYRDGVGAIAGSLSVEGAKDLLEEANELGHEFEGGKPCSATPGAGGTGPGNGAGNGNGNGNGPGNGNAPGPPPGKGKK